MVISKFFSEKFLFNLLISFVPISYIIGNLVINLNVLLLIISVILIFRGKLFKLELNRIDQAIIFFFLYVIVNGSYNNYFNFNFPDAPNQNLVLSKSIQYLRFLLLYLAIRFLLKENIINFKIIFISFGLCSLFVSLDLFIQYIFGKDLFGFEVRTGERYGRRLAGPFGDEYIAGGFIQRFFIFLPFTFLIFIKANKKTLVLSLTLIFFLITILATFLSGNRVPLVLSFFVLVITFFFEKDLRQVLILLFLLLIISFYFLIISNENILIHYENLVIKINEVFIYFENKLFSDKRIILANTHIKEIETGFLTWELNKYFGGGIKSFYFHCSNIDKDLMVKFIGSCNTHPHNYYIQIAAELGIFMFFFISLFFLIVIINVIKKIYMWKKFNYERKIITAFFVVFLAEIFPFKTTGSLFTSSNSTFLFIILAFIVGLLDKENLKSYERR